MTVNKNEIFLLKSQADEGNDKYELVLKENGFTVKNIQVLNFQYINLSNLNEKLSTPDLYSGLIFTSPRSVHATAQSLDNSPLNSKWLSKDNFVVGETTFELVEKELRLICKGSETGNANNLADLIIRKTYDLPFLFPCGNLKRETLAQRLNEHSLKLDAVTVYETIKYHNLESDFYKLTNNLEMLPEYIVYFSPSGVKFTADVLKRCLERSNEIKLVAIGPSTAEALRTDSFPVYTVASKPNETELLNSIIKQN